MMDGFIGVCMAIVIAGCLIMGALLGYGLTHHREYTCTGTVATPGAVTLVCTRHWVADR
jgi:hypothetical protein